MSKEDIIKESISNSEKFDETKLMQKHFCILNVIQPTQLNLDFIQDQIKKFIYVKIDNVFYISANVGFNDSFKSKLKEENINCILIYVHIKTSCDVYYQDVDDEEGNVIKDIILDDR